MASTGLARVGFTATGGQTVFSYAGITLLDSVADSAQLAVYVDGVLQTLTTDYTVDAGSEEITFVVGRTAGEAISIQRDTKDDARYVDFTNNSFIEESVLDLDSNQLFFLGQEIIDTLSNTMTKNPAATAWEGQGLPADNFSPGSSANSLVTVGQMDAALAGVTVTTIDNVDTWLFSGNGSTTDFTLSSAPGGLTTADQLFVFISGVRQVHTADYTLDTSGATPVLSFTTAPPTGSNNVYVNVVTGDTVAATVGTGEITTAMLADNAVTLDKIDGGTHDGTKTRFITVAADGTPTITAISVSQLDDFQDDLYGDYRWSRMQPPVGTVAMNNQKIGGLGTGTEGTDAVNKAQMDAAIAAAIAAL